MIRKQIYIARSQQALLTRLAQSWGVSEAEVVRQAIEHEAVSDVPPRLSSSAEALEELIQFALSRREASVTGEPLRWNREDAYSERLDRFGPPHNGQPEGT
jgi:hypothetical protein